MADSIPPGLCKLPDHSAELEGYNCIFTLKRFTSELRPNIYPHLSNLDISR